MLLLCTSHTMQTIEYASGIRSSNLCSICFMCLFICWRFKYKIFCVYKKKYIKTKRKTKVRYVCNRSENCLNCSHTQTTHIHITCETKKNAHFKRAAFIVNDDDDPTHYFFRFILFYFVLSLTLFLSLLIQLNKFHFLFALAAFYYINDFKQYWI